ncbi:CAP domain-containing protein [Hoeflea prorocentri]|uniref:CAP domain-containing protein n=1 Tax=Hoeflea prorocentri TaxID=1922333 RepID=A0A9X3UKF4_9HYPH|nr:CAP domain-containing protein [Hoeflea prorocentri]MCY6380511.1 CAP domain-containing protein [Hoeflea prorocentri]MDA5398311.1 CAP domain-containing protein [Hoeflea prorocentri]
MIQRRGFLITGGGAALCLTALTWTNVPANAAASIVTGRALGRVNTYRRSKKRPNLASDQALGRAALAHSKAMAKSGRLSHAKFRSRLRSFGIRGAAAENVAMGQPDIASVIAAWQNSRGHRRNMLGNFSRVGVAVARDPATGNRPYWTMILAR